MDALEGKVAEQKMSGPNGICTELASLPAGAHLDASALGRILGRHTKTVQKAARRGELPPPIEFLGRHVWLAGAIQTHLLNLQRSAVEGVAKRNDKIKTHSLTSM
jgi:hypothetical protein